MFMTKAPEAGRSCNTSEAAPIADGAFAGLFALGAAVEIDEAMSEFPDSEAEELAVLAGATALLFTASAIRGFVNVGKCRRHEQAEYERSLAAHARSKAGPPSRRDAWEVTQQAAAAARAGDCETVIALDKVLLGFDTEFRRTVFVRDVAIRRCFTRDEIEIAPPSATEPTEPAAP